LIPQPSGTDPATSRAQQALARCTATSSAHVEALGYMTRAATNALNTVALLLDQQQPTGPDAQAAHAASVAWVRTQRVRIATELARHAERIAAIHDGAGVPDPEQRLAEALEVMESAASCDDPVTASESAAEDIRRAWRAGASVYADRLYDLAPRTRPTAVAS